METLSFSFQFEESSNTAREITNKIFESYQMEQNAPDEEETEARWIADKKKLYYALSLLTPQQRKVYILRFGYGLQEKAIAKKLHMKQQTVSKHLVRAQKKLQKFTGKTTD